MKHFPFIAAVWFSVMSCAIVRANEIASPPTSIASDLSKDVTAELNAWLAALPNNTTIQFSKDARYRIDQTILIEGKEGISIEGNGVLFQCFDAGEDHEKKTSYGGWRRTRTKAHVRITNCKGIQIRNLEIHGAHPDPGKEGTFDYNREAQHGFDLVKVEDCTLEKVNVHDVYGDCVYIAKAQGIVVKDSILRRCGRQGLAVGTGEDILIENNEIADSRRGIIDLEPYGKEWKASNIRIIGNRLGGSRLLLLPMGGSGTLGTVFVADNTNAEHNGTPAVGNRGKPGQRRGPFMMVGNSFTIGGSPAAGLRVEHNDGVFIAGNSLVFPKKRMMTALDLDGSTGVVVAGNHFSDASRITEESPEMINLSNTLQKEASPCQTQWKRVVGGFAARVVVEDGEVIAIMRGGPATAARPKTVEAYGQSTSAEFAWFHVRDGILIASGMRKND